jgi:hypothetical protein
MAEEHEEKKSAPRKGTKRKETHDSNPKKTKNKPPLPLGSGSESHGFLWTPRGFERANFMGPGTDLFGRLERGDQGKTAIDQISKLHDIDYTLASGLSTTDETQGNLGRAADERMIQKGWKAYKEGKENLFNTIQGAGLIRAKNFLEDWGIISKTKFLGPRTFKYVMGAQNRDTSEFEILLRARYDLVCDDGAVTGDEKECENTKRDLSAL